MMPEMTHCEFLSDVLREAIALGEQQFGTSDQPREDTQDPEPVFSSLSIGARPSISDQTNVENLIDFSFASSENAAFALPIELSGTEPHNVRSGALADSGPFVTNMSEHLLTPVSTQPTQSEAEFLMHLLGSLSETQCSDPNLAWLIVPQTRSAFQSNHLNFQVRLYEAWHAETAERYFLDFSHVDCETFCSVVCASWLLKSFFCRLKIL
jgi:hypothetical protein